MARENPWATLKARPHVRLLWKVLPNGMAGQWAGGDITLNPNLGRVELRCALMHELVHEDRRIGWPFATTATMEAEERIVRQETALRLVPLDELHALALNLEGLAYVTAELVAEEFDVTVQVAHLALQVLNRRLMAAELAQAARPDHGEAAA